MFKSIVKFIFTSLLLCIVIFNVNACFVLDTSNEIYYNDINVALSDVKNGCIGKHANLSSSQNVVKILKQNKHLDITLLQNIIIEQPLEIIDVYFDLNGHSITVKSDTGLIIGGKTEIIGNLEGSAILSDRDNVTLISIRRAATCKIYGGNFSVSANDGRLCGIHVYGNLELYDTSILINGNPTDQTNHSVYGIYGNLFSKVKIENSRIEAYTQDGNAFAFFNGDSAEVKDSTLTGFSNYMSNESAFTQYSVGCYNNGTLALTNCNVSGIHSGVDSCGSLIVNGGTYSGFGHGGIYFAGSNQTSYVVNATLQEIVMPDGYTSHGPNSTHGGCYIGGGNKNDNLIVYMNNCKILATKHAIVLRGTSHEKNNQVYVSNTTIDVLSVRIDNDTHKLHIGMGCNFGQEHTTIPDVVYLTEDIYCEEQN